MGVEVRLSSYIEADDVIRESPDEVIVATGSIPRLDGIQIENPGEPIEGILLPHVLFSGDLFMNSQKDLGSSAVVIDDVGHYEAIATVEHLLKEGLSVTLVTRLASMAPLLETALTVRPALGRIGMRDFHFHPRTRVTRIERGTVTIAPTYLPVNTNSSIQVSADSVIFISHNLPMRDLYNELRSKGISSHIVGDANSPRFLAYAIREGYLAGARV